MWIVVLIITIVPKYCFILYNG